MGLEFQFYKMKKVCRVIAQHYAYGGGLSRQVVSDSCNSMDCIACQVPLSMGFSRQQYWSGLPFPSPGDLPDPGIEPRSAALQADSLPTEL